ncbi:hypothetical protein [Cohnella thermotolerans]|uniref:hypothetical protein n=1 Tax=Cohnella thermotolerans TaxID=329858 RepID=UPI000424F8D7|nr:hypothetical protein [Cohnella thermotolerans]
MDQEWAWLAVWLIGLFSLIGFVMAAVANLVRKDTREHDKKFVWRMKSNWDKDIK